MSTYKNFSLHYIIRQLQNIFKIKFKVKAIVTKNDFFLGNIMSYLPIISQEKYITSAVKSDNPIAQYYMQSYRK